MPHQKIDSKEIAEEKKRKADRPIDTKRSS
jgi:hypothetical protein